MLPSSVHSRSPDNAVHNPDNAMQCSRPYPGSSYEQKASRAASRSYENIICMFDCRPFHAESASQQAWLTPKQQQGVDAAVHGLQWTAANTAANA